MKKRISVFYVIGILAFGVLCLTAYAPQAQSAAVEEQELSSQDISMLALSGEVKNGIRIIDVKAFKYGFDPDPIVVNQGDKVQVDVQSTDVAHGFAIANYNVDVRIPARETKSVVFIADTKGVFDIVCSVFCGAGHGHMKAKLIVK
jgi:cytochrome c oxidase subunit 2